MKDKKTKSIFKKVVNGYVNKNLINAPKRGFTYNIVGSYALKEKFRKEIILDYENTSKFFNYDTLKDLIEKDYRTPRETYMILKILVFEIWFKNTHKLWVNNERHNMIKYNKDD